MPAGCRYSPVEGIWRTVSCKILLCDTRWLLKGKGKAGGPLPASSATTPAYSHRQRAGRGSQQKGKGQEEAYSLSRLYLRSQRGVQRWGGWGIARDRLDFYHECCPRREAGRIGSVLIECCFPEREAGVGKKPRQLRFYFWTLAAAALGERLQRRSTFPFRC